MKDHITIRLTETRRAIILLEFFKLLLDSLAVFTFFDLLAIFLGINIAVIPTVIFLGINITYAVYAVIPTVAFFIVKFIMIITDKHVLEKVVKKYPSLDERLQTAFDNQAKPNLITDKLIAYVANDMTSISYSAFLGAGRIALSVVAVTALLLTAPAVVKYKDAVFSLSNGISNQFNDYFFPGNGDGSGSDTMSMGGGKDWNQSSYGNKQETQKVGGGPGGMAPGYSEGPLAGMGGGTGENDNQNIYGAPTSARIEGENVKMEVHPEYGGEVSIEDTTQPPSDIRGQVPGEIESASSDTSQDPVEYEEVIKNYFDRLSQEGGK